MVTQEPNIGRTKAALLQHAEWLAAELARAQEKIAALEVRVRADDAALEHTVNAKADLQDELTQLRRRFERLEMRWHDEHDHALEFAADILSTCGVFESWLVLHTAAQRQAAEFLRRRGLAESHPNQGHMARFIGGVSRESEQQDQQRRQDNATGPTEDDDRAAAAQDPGI